MDALLLLKASLLLSITLGSARLLRRAPAASRHRLWSLAFAALLALPLLSSVLPAFHVRVPAGWRASVRLPQRSQTAVGHAADATDPLAQDRIPASDTNAVVETLTPRAIPSEIARAAAWPIIAALLMASWLVGTAAASGALLLSLLRVRRLARTAEDLDDGAWRRAADALGARLGLRRAVRLLASDAVCMPMAGGVWRPVIFLPASARDWRAERRDVVLAHELAHLAGRDPLRHVAARLAIALYWFHPLAWMAARASAVAREQACDEAVLALGTRPSAYAQVLLDLADSIHVPAPALAALPMVDRSLLEIRLMAILQDDRRPTTRRPLLMPAIVVALLTMSVAAARPGLDPGVGPVVALASATMAAGAPASTSLPPWTPNVTDAAVSAAPPQPVAGANSNCWSDSFGGSSFSGSISTSRSGGLTMVDEQIGRRGADRVVQQRIGDLRVCMLAEGIGAGDTSDRPSQWLTRARRVVMETRRGGAGGLLQQLEVERQAAGAPRLTWTVGSSPRAFDAAAQQWRDRLLAVLDTIWEMSALRGDVSTLRGDISTIHGEESSLRGEMSSLQGEVSSMHGRASSIRGEESSLRGEISSIQGELSSMRGQISSEAGAISSLNAGGAYVDAAERTRIAAGIAQHEAEIGRIEQRIRDYDANAKIAAVERQIRALDADGKIKAIDAEIRAFDLDGKLAAIERRIAALDVGGKVAGIDRQITALDADRRVRQLEARRDAELKQLEAAIAAIR